MQLKTICLLSLIMNCALSIPPNDKALFPDGDPEFRKNNKKRRPCFGRSNDPEGRTFFDWTYQHVNVDYNTNYNINCGGNGGGNKPQGGGLIANHFASHQNGQGGQGGLLGGLLANHLASHQQPQGAGVPGNPGNRPPNRPLVGLVQSQAQGIFSNIQNSGIFNDIGSGQILSNLGSLLPQGDFFNGQGISSLFQNGLFNNIFSPQSSSSSAASNVPSIPNNRPPPIQAVGQNPVNVPAGTTIDPNDIIYNDERPVHEDHDPVFPDTYNSYNRPGSRPRPAYRPQNYNSYRDLQQNQRSNIRFE